MSRLKLQAVQVGTNSDSTKNFAVDASQADGTLKISRGNLGATTQDVLTVAASTGKIDFPQLARTIGASGSYELPGGLILKWGKSASSATGSVTVALDFQNAVFNFSVTPDIAVGASAVFLNVDSSTTTKSGATVFARNQANNAYIAVNFFWFAIGN